MTTATAYVQQPTPDLCQSACISMVLRTTDVFGVRSELESIALKQGTDKTGAPSVMGEYLESRVKTYNFLIDGSLSDAKKALDEGCVVITHGWFTRIGHVILLLGYEPDMDTFSYRFMVNDPYAEYDFSSGEHDLSKSGEDVRYSSYGIYATCVESYDYKDARDTYSRKELNPTLQNAWLHIIQN